MKFLATNPMWSGPLAPLRASLLYALAFSTFVNVTLIAPTLYMLQVFDRVLSSRSEATLLMLSLAVFVTLVAMSLVDMARARLLTELGRDLDEALSRPMLARVMREASTPAQKRASTSLRDLATLRTFLSGPNVIAVFDAPWMLIYMLVIFIFHPLMGMVSLVGAVALIGLAWLTERTNRPDLESLAGASRAGAAYIDTGIRNADVINGLGMTPAFSERWARLNGKTLDLMQSSAQRGSGFLAGSKFLRQAIQVAMMGLGAWLVLEAEASPGVMMAGTILFGRAMAPVESLIGNWGGLVAARSAWSRLEGLIPQLFAEQQRTELPEPLGRVQVERIALAGAVSDSAPILRHVEFDLPAGRSLAIIGPSGSGKSSLARILVGVWTPTAGKVRIDGAEISHWNPDELGRHFGYLPQDVELLPGTIAENIARFQPSSGDALIAAARRANAYEMILKLPKGFDTLLGEGGIRLSAGQAQRVGLARALYGQPAILVLDEPNANLDAEGEQALVKALADVAGTTTVIMITHKPSLVAHLDYLLVLREGRMELMGPRDEVMARLSGGGS